MDDAVSYAFACKWENKSYPSIILGVIPKLLPVSPFSWRCLTWAGERRKWV